MKLNQKLPSDWSRFLFENKKQINQKHYSKTDTNSLCPNLIDVQRESFYSFLQEGLPGSFQESLHFSTSQYQLEIKFFPESLQFRKPDLTEQQCIVLGKTYGCCVYIPVGIRVNFLVSPDESSPKTVNQTSQKKGPSKPLSTEIETDSSPNSLSEVTSDNTASPIPKTIVPTEPFRIEWLQVGLLPLMTQHGHFLINGIPRVVLHQIIRNPGIYTIPRDSRIQTETIRIIPEKGGWINLTTDKKYRLWFHTRLLRRKVSLLIVLQALGFSPSELFQRLKYSKLLNTSYVKEFSTQGEEPKTRHDKILERANLKSHPKTQQEAWNYLYAHFLEYSPYSRNEYVTNETARDFFWNRFWNSETLVLGEIGRQQFREKVGSQVPLENISLTAQDLLLATQALLDLLHDERLGDEIDSLTQKRIRGCEDFLVTQLVLGIEEFQNFLRRKVTSLPSRKQSSVPFPKPKFSGQSTMVPNFSILGKGRDLQNDQQALHTVWRQNKVVFSKIVSKSWKRFFTSGTLAQYMDQTNPLAETTHKRRLTVLGPGGVSSKQTTIQIRGIHPTYYGRLCPIETPEGKNAGLVNSFTVFAKREKNFYGTITTPFYRVFKGQVQKNLPPLLVSPHQEYSLIGAPADIQVSSWNLLPNCSLPVRKQLNFESENSNRITTQSIGILQTLSVATSLIPFLEHDDANRALMGSNMQRQAVPLLNPESPIVGTGLETRVLSDVNHVVQASQSGYITSSTSRIVKTIAPVRNCTSKSSVFSKRVQRPFSKNLGKGQTLPQKSLFYSSKQTRLVTQQQSRETLESIFQTSSFSQFKNRDFSEKALPSQLLGNKTTQTTYNLTQYQRTNQSTCRYDRSVLPETNWVEKGDIIADGAASSRGKLSIGQNVFVAYLPWEGYNFEDAILISERLVDQDIFTSLHIDHYEIEVKNTQHGLETMTKYIPLKIDESARDILKIEKLNSRGLVERGTWVEEGDYLVGKVSPVNPKGPSIEQQYEKLYNVIMQREKTQFRNTSLRVPKGVEGFVLDVQILPSLEPDVVALAEKDAILRVRVVLLQRRRIQVGDKMAGRHGNKGIVSAIVPRENMPYLPDGTPIDIVLNPLGVPSRMNVGQIFECLLGLAGNYLHEKYTISLFDERFGAEASRSLVFSKLYEASVKTSNPWLFEPHHPGKIKVFDGRTGLPFDQPITVGCAYMLKLVHLVDDKIHARSTGPYSAVTQQPVRGRSRNGGQRLGEMEVWALQAYGAAATLHEFFTLKSDDIEGRKQAVVRIYANKPLPPGRPESFKVLLRELQALCFDLQLYKNPETVGINPPISLYRLEKLLQS